MRKTEGVDHMVKADVLTDGAIGAVLGIRKPVPLTAEAMAKTLRVTFFPSRPLTPRLTGFVEQLRRTLSDSGTSILSFDDALAENSTAGGPRRGKRKLREGIVVIAAGDLETGNIPVDYVSNLRNNTVVWIIDGPCPADAQSDMQEKLNSLVRVLGWSLAQVVIFVEDERWTIGTMNGAIIPCPDRATFGSDVLRTLVPKLAAPVVPPHASDFDFEEGGLDLADPKYAEYVGDFLTGGPLWGATGLMLFHTSLDALEFRSPFYRRIAAAYLDRRSGMSYGFLARQLATPVVPALTDHEADALLGEREWRERGFTRLHNRLHVAARLNGRTFLVGIPDVHVLSTRSGCDKSHIDSRRDLILMTLSDGRISFKTPASVGGATDYKPSYDTVTILAHAIGNVIVAALQLWTDPHAAFARTLQTSGVALAHWHGTLSPAILPPGFRIHGDANPPVSCSTHQASIFALTGKLGAFSTAVDRGLPYEGDVHIEPHHGINVTWPTLTGLAEKLLQADRVKAGPLAKESAQS